MGFQFKRGTVFLILTAYSLILGLGGCVTIYNPATGRRETVLNTSIEQALGSMARAQMGLSSLRMGEVPEAQLGRVQQIGKRLAAVSDRRDIPYRFGVVQQKSLNAFTLPDATIYVHSGLLEKTTDEELAAVLAHEVGHVAARHAAKHLQADLGLALLLSAAGAAGASGDSVRVANSLGGLFRNGFSRKDELEADRLAIRYAGRAGYDPKALISFFEKMNKEHPETAANRATAWQRTHPLTSERITHAQKELKAADSRQGKFYLPADGLLIHR